MAVPRARIQDLLKVQCHLYNHTYNPSGARTGASVLREKLKGPSVAAYYPPRVSTIKDLLAMFPDWETFQEDEAERQDSLAIMQARGKGAPKKKRTAEEGRKFKKRK